MRRAYACIEMNNEKATLQNGGDAGQYEGNVPRNIEDRLFSVTRMKID